MTPRPAGARTKSLCGTARRERLEAQAVTTPRQRCRHAALWICQSSADCSRRMEFQRR
jgi:hypothetical protein